MIGFRKKRGETGETLAARHLEKAGCRILERNWRCRAGEVDLIAAEGGTILFVEVKARTDASFGAPLDAVNGRKRKRIIAAARLYIAQKGLAGVPARFDAVGVRLDRDPPAIEWVKSAFDVGSRGV